MEKNAKKALKLISKILGIIILTFGAVLLYFGYYDFITSLINKTEPTLFLCSYLGIPIASIGLTLTVYGFIGTVSLNIKTVHLSSNNDKIPSDENSLINHPKDGANICPECGTINDNDSKFCKFCGKKLQ